MVTGRVTLLNCFLEKSTEFLKDGAGGPAAEGDYKVLEKLTIMSKTHILL